MSNWKAMVCVAVLAVAPASAQENQGVQDKVQDKIKVRTMSGEVAVQSVAAMSDTIAFTVSDDVNIAAVKGMPFSAETVTEFRQILGDGNQIERRSTGAVYRDGEGRSRSETPVGGLGPFAPEEATEKVIRISDPVTQSTMFLHPGRKTATHLHTQGVRPDVTEKIRAEMGERVRTEVGQKVRLSTEAPHVEILRAKMDQVKTEDLGSRAFEGVQAVGKRTVFTIPAGQVGNVRPIEIVDEVWYSPDLKIEVMTRHADPRSGEQTYQLRGIRLGEPSRDLFQLPPDYSVENQNLRMMVAPAARAERADVVWVEKKKEE